MSDRPLCVLLVDDDPEDALIVRRLLEKATVQRFEVTPRTDYASGLEALYSGDYHACLLDYRLGRDSGLDFLREAAATVPDVPVVMLTGQGDESVDLAAMEAGAVDYLVKGELTTALLERTLRYAVRQADTMRALSASEARFRSLTDGSPALTWIHEVGDEEAFFSGSWLTFTGHGSQAGLAGGWLERVHPDDRAAYAVALATVARTGQPREVEYRARTTDESFRWLLEKVVPYFGHDGRVAGYAGSAIDITERREAEEQRRLALAVFSAAAEGIMVTDTDNVIVTVNPAFTTITGYGSDEAVGRRPDFLSSGLHDAEFYRAMWARLEEEGHWAGEIWNRRKDGEVFVEWLSIMRVTDSSGRPRHYVGVFSDVTERKRQEELITYQANYDALTDLPNRALFQDRLEKGLARVRRHGGQLALLFLDLDGFKAVNDSLGHAAGDHLLQQAAARLGGCVRESDTLARLGGDEFTVILPDVDRPEDAERVARKVIEILDHPFDLDGREARVSASVGISVYPDHAADAEDLMRHADNAMYTAKARGRGAWAFHERGVDSNALGRRALAAELKVALANNDIVLHYQPLMACDGETAPAAVEALVRWDSDVFANLPSACLAEVAAEFGFGGALMRRVVREACQQARAWREHRPGLRINVNLSPVQGNTETLAADILAIVEETGLPPGALMVDVAETTLAEGGRPLAEALEDLRRRGVLVALDDFGTGRMELADLVHGPVDWVKIDVSLIAAAPDDATKARQVAAILAAGRALGLTVVAEGVETPAQAAFLREHGCDLAQGTHLAPAMPPEALAAAWPAVASTP